MRKIVKTHPPQALIDWLDENIDVNNTYDSLNGTNAHKALKDKLLKEQGYICAYTGQEINASSSHVEHIKPKSQCDDGEDVDYKNLVACFPSNGGDKSHGYGAPMKGDWWDDQKFVSPLSDDCERRFKFSWNGRVCPNLDDDKAAETTIGVLCLDNGELQNLREAQIKSFFGWSRRNPKGISDKDAQMALRNIDKIDSNGHLMEFCFVLKQLLPRYISGAKAR